MKLFTKNEEDARMQLRDLGVRFYDEDAPSNRIADAIKRDECAKQAQTTSPIPYPPDAGYATGASCAQEGNESIAGRVARSLEHRAQIHERHARTLRELSNALPKVMTYDAAEAVMSLLNTRLPIHV